MSGSRPLKHKGAGKPRSKSFEHKPRRQRPKSRAESHSLPAAAAEPLNDTTMALCLLNFMKMMTFHTEKAKKSPGPS